MYGGLCENSSDAIKLSEDINMRLLGLFLAFFASYYGIRSTAAETWPGLFAKLIVRQRDKPKGVF